MFTDTFLPEFDLEMAATRKLLERLPADRLDWKPHAKSRSLGQLAGHVAELPRWGMRVDRDTFEAGSEPVPPLRTAADFVARFDDNVRQGRQGLAGKTDGDLQGKLAVFHQGRERFAFPKTILLRRVLMNHLIHHRAQLTVYLRLLDVPVPPLYGPTADEDI
jgi:uncharacterized damage-inducible protein DinB